jgi:hypothetical protein
MNDFTTSSIHNGEEKEHGSPTPSIHYGPPASTCSDRVAELEIENSRLHRLVAELLTKNPQLRKPE